MPDERVRLVALFAEATDGVERAAATVRSAASELGAARAVSLDRRTMSMVIDDGVPTVDRGEAEVAWAAAVITEPGESEVGRAALESVIAAGASAAVLVDSAQHFGLLTTEPSGDGVHLFGVLKRRVGMSVDEFASHWRDVHVPLTLSLEPQFSSYVTLVVQASRGDFPWDGIVFDLFETAARYDRHLAVESPHKKAAFEDNKEFMSAMTLYFGEREAVVR